MLPNSYTTMFAYLRQLMLDHASMFESAGLNIYLAFAGSLLVIFGLNAMASGLDAGRFVRLLLRIAIGFALLTFYSRPTPLFGDRSLVHLITDQGTILANQIEGSTVSRITARLTLLYGGIEAPGIGSLLIGAETIRWGITMLMLLASQAILFLIISIGYIFVACAVLVGPLFIPFWIVPGMKWVFDGWFRSLLQYAFYPVIAQAFLSVYGSMLINFVDRAGTDLTAAQLATHFMPLLSLLIGFTVGLLKVPSFVRSLFTGSSGESASPI